MLQGITPSSSSKILVTNESYSHSIVHVRSQRSDTLTSSEKKPSFCDRVVILLSDIWDWIKFNLLVCFFDRNEENRESLEDELVNFHNKAFFDQVEDREPNSFAVECFKKLNPELQKRLRRKVAYVIRRYNPEITTAGLEIEVKRITEIKPWGEILNSNPLAENTDKTCYPMVEAIQLVHNSLKFPEEGA